MRKQILIIVVQLFFTFLVHAEDKVSSADFIKLQNMSVKFSADKQIEIRKRVQNADSSKEKFENLSFKIGSFYTCELSPKDAEDRPVALGRGGVWLKVPPSKGDSARPGSINTPASWVIKWENKGYKSLIANFQQKENPSQIQLQCAFDPSIPLFSFKEEDRKKFEEKISEAQKECALSDGKIKSSPTFEGSNHSQINMISCISNSKKSREEAPRISKSALIQAFKNQGMNLEISAADDSGQGTLVYGEKKNFEEPTKNTAAGAAQ